GVPDSRPTSEDSIIIPRATQGVGLTRHGLGHGPYCRTPSPGPGLPCLQVASTGLLAVAAPIGDAAPWLGCPGTSRDGAFASAGGSTRLPTAASSQAPMPRAVDARMVAPVSVLARPASDRCRARTASSSAAGR